MEIKTIIPSLSGRFTLLFKLQHLFHLRDYLQLKMYQYNKINV